MVPEEIIATACQTVAIGAKSCRGGQIWLTFVRFRSPRSLLLQVRELLRSLSHQIGLDYGMEGANLEEIFKKAQAEKSRVAEEVKPSMDTQECFWPVALNLLVLGVGGPGRKKI